LSSTLTASPAMFGSIPPVINVILIHMYMIAGFQQEAAFGCQSISNLFRGAALLYPSVQANRTKPVSTWTPNLLLRIP
jgi:hypothetical protein